MLIDSEIKLDFNDVLIRPKRSTLLSRKDVELTRKFVFKHSRHTYTGIPIMAANMDGVGTLEMANELQNHGLFTCLIKSYNNDADNFKAFKVKQNNYAISTGTSNEEFDNLNAIVLGVGAQFICIDVANGYSENFGKVVEKIRSRWPYKTIIAGNVVTADMTQELILRGADIVKVGIGPGSVCTTRIKTGVGYPQLSAIIECSDAAHGLDAHIIADGGCTSSGDVAKAFGAGADFVMLGGMLAGHDEGGGEKITRYFNELGEQFISNSKTEEYEFCAYKKEFIQFYGMSSDTAMEKNYGSIANYRSSEGRTVEVPYRGSVKNTILDILGGLRSSMTYIGAKRLKDFSKCTTFIRCNRTYNNIFE